MGIWAVFYQYFINNKVSTQTHLLHGAGQLWYQDIIPDKKLYLDIPDSHIIGATVFIAGMIDAAFDLPHEHHCYLKNSCSYS